MATSFNTYEDYCADRTKRGLQVIPRRLWVALHEDDSDV